MILINDHGLVREVRLNRPPVNALIAELLVTLREAIQAAPRDGVRALILSGAPGRFSAGLDVPLLLGSDRAAMAVLWRELYALLHALAASPIPIAAALTGHAPAGGTVLALFCDWRVMAQEDYKLGLNEVQVGIPLPPVLLGALRRLVGSRQAERLAVSGILISPQEALRVGLVDDVAAMDQVIARALDWCQRMVALPSEAMLATRRTARADLLHLFEVNLEPEIQRVIENWWSPSTQSTLRALVERMGKKASS
ncbi:MAG: enoyl-CoA hydratase/isomerase family protein [Acidobacteria bacterium]|nr:MAG: enoyl-CoA hydratase/isomerase family protein [Acidobacteriota bacterium]